MVYKIRWKKGNKTFESKITFKTKKTAQRRANFIKQIDDDLPKSKRDKSLKTYRTVKVAIPKKIRK